MSVALLKMGSMTDKPEGAGLGQRLRELRKKAGLSQEELAHLAGLADQTAISRIERVNGYQPQSFTLFKIARALGTTVDELLTGIIEVKPKPIPDEGKARSLRDQVGILARNQAHIALTMKELMERLDSLTVQERESRSQRRSGERKK